MSQTSIITGPERRRRWSDEQKLELLTEAFGPGGSVAEVARRADICTSLLYRWRQLMRAAPTLAGVVPAALNEDTESPPPGPIEAAIYVVLAGRVTVTISRDASRLSPPPSAPFDDRRARIGADLIARTRRYAQGDAGARAACSGAFQV